eukprot:4442618-Pleurochrysis_carterae.AAC.3
MRSQRASLTKGAPRFRKHRSAPRRRTARHDAREGAAEAAAATAAAAAAAAAAVAAAAAAAAGTAAAAAPGTAAGGGGGAAAAAGTGTGGVAGAAPVFRIGHRRARGMGKVVDDEAWFDLSLMGTRWTKLVRATGAQRDGTSCRQTRTRRMRTMRSRPRSPRRPDPDPKLHCEYPCRAQSLSARASFSSVSEVARSACALFPTFAILRPRRG